MPGAFFSHPTVCPPHCPMPPLPALPPNYLGEAAGHERLEAFHPSPCKEISKSTNRRKLKHLKAKRKEAIKRQAMFSLLVD